MSYFSVGPSALEQSGANITAQAACLAAAFSYALAGIYGRRFKRMGVAPIATATGQVTASTLMLLPVALLVDQPWTLPLPGPATFAAIGGIAALSTALAYVLYFRILSTAGATNLLLVTFLIPVSAILLGWLVLGERLDHRHLLGMALIGETRGDRWAAVEAADAEKCQKFVDIQPGSGRRGRRIDMLRTAKIHDRVASFSDRPHAARADLRFPVAARNVEDIGRLAEARERPRKAATSACPSSIDRRKWLVPGARSGWCR